MVEGLRRHRGKGEAGKPHRMWRGKIDVGSGSGADLRDAGHDAVSFLT